MKLSDLVTQVTRPLHFRLFVAPVILALLCSLYATAQVRTLLTHSQHVIPLPATAGREVVLGSVLLGEPRTFKVFNIQASGTIAPDPEMNGAAFQLEFLICDQPDCSGELRMPMRVLPDANATTGAQVIATRSFGVSTHNVDPVVLTGLKPRASGGVLFLAAALRVVDRPANTAFGAKLNLMRVEVLP